MKNWLLCFFALLIGIVSVTLGANCVFSEESTPKLTILSGGEITEITVEEYSLRILLAESENCGNSETKKALAVAARSVGLYLSVFGCKHEDFDACDDGNCCIQLGKAEDFPESVVADCKNAVDSTKGLALTIDDLPAMALFCGCSGSGTTDCREFPYLVSVAEHEQCQIHISEKLCDYSSLTPVLLCESDFESLKEDPLMVYDEMGKCTFAVLGNKYVPAEELARALGISGREFTLSFSEEGISSRSFGTGEGYGMSVCGAEKLANDGMEFEQILKNYYPNLILNKLYNN